MNKDPLINTLRDELNQWRTLAKKSILMNVVAAAFLLFLFVIHLLERYGYV